MFFWTCYCCGLWNKFCCCGFWYRKELCPHFFSQRIFILLLWLWVHERARSSFLFPQRIFILPFVVFFLRIFILLLWLWVLERARFFFFSPEFLFCCCGCGYRKELGTHFLLSWEFLSLLLPSSVSASHPFISQWRHAYANLHEGLWTLWSFIYSF